MAWDSALFVHYKHQECGCGKQHTSEFLLSALFFFFFFKALHASRILSIILNWNSCTQKVLSRKEDLSLRCFSVSPFGKGFWRTNKKAPEVNKNWKKKSSWSLNFGFSFCLHYYLFKTHSSQPTVKEEVVQWKTPTAWLQLGAENCFWSSAVEKTKQQTSSQHKKATSQVNHTSNKIGWLRLQVGIMVFIFISLWPQRNKGGNIAVPSSFDHYRGALLII